VRDLAALARGDGDADLLVRIARAGLAGVERQRMRLELGLAEPELAARLGRLAADQRIVVSETGTCLAASACEELERRALDALGALHAREPLRPGFARSELAAALPANVAGGALGLALARLVAGGRAVETADGLRSAAHRGALAGADRELAERVEREARHAGLEPPNLKEWAALCAQAPEKLRAILQQLARQGVLVAAPDDFWFDRAAVDALRARVVAHLRAHGSLETPAYKALIGTSRKHAVPLMELFDRERTTLRVGNKRVLRGGK
jgi:selenocysteine-specific elongation factor